LRELALVKKSGSQRPMRLSREAAELLSRCDGETSFESILQGHVEGSGRGSDFDVCKSLLAISRLIELGLVARRDRPLPTRPRITRELDAYYPASLHVELTARCNLRCFFCYREAGPEVREPRLETRELLRILSDLRDRGLTTVELTGGEPLLHPDFPEILDFCGENFATIVLLTNGTVMTDALLDALVSQREKLFVNVSLDNHDPEEHDRRRGRRGSFQKTTRTIRTLARHGIWVRVAMAVRM
jgi:sulfatase maturation enzyme AslB (radical SAM superfamily)